MKLLLVYDNLKKRSELLDAIETAAKELQQDGLEMDMFSPVKTESQICSGCGACKGAGMCVFDPRGKEFMKAAAEYDAFIFAAHGGVLGLNIEMKNFLEQISLFALRRERNPLSGKKASVLLICRRGGRNAARQTAALVKKTGAAVQNSGELSVITGGAEEMNETLLNLARLMSGN